MAEKTVGIKGMTCGHCETRVSKEIMSIPGVTSVIASAEKANAVITSNSEISHDSIQRAVLAAGYSILP
jgi:copper chaperone CopZ